MKSRRIHSGFFILLSFALITNIAHGKTYKTILSYIKQQQNSGALWRASWAVYAEYTDNGKTIINWNGSKNLIPASGMKLFTTAAALKILGEKTDFATKIYYDGTINDAGLLDGSLYIVGGGDPSLASTLMKNAAPLDSVMQQITQKIRNAGIANIKGGVYADDLLFDGNPLPDNWVWSDIGNYYGARTSALSVHDNLYFLRLKPGRRVGAEVTVVNIEPKIQGLTFINRLKTGSRGSGDHAYIYCAPGQYKARLEGTVPLGSAQFTIKGAMPDPALFFVRCLKYHLEGEGIKVGKKAKKIDKIRKYNRNKFIGRLNSPPLSEIVYWINKRSINLFAEQLLKMIAVKISGVGNIKNGVQAVEEFLEDIGISIDGFQMDDGSGLSRTNTTNAKMVADLLRKMTIQPFFGAYYNSFSVAGNAMDDGVYKNFGTGTILQNNARLKSGTLYRIRSHSGYLRDRDGRLIAFSMIANNYDGSISKIDAIHKKIMLMLAGLKMEKI